MDIQVLRHFYCLLTPCGFHRTPVKYARLYFWQRCPFINVLDLLYINLADRLPGRGIYWELRDNIQEGNIDTTWVHFGISWVIHIIQERPDTGLYCWMVYHCIKMEKPFPLKVLGISQRWVQTKPGPYSKNLLLTGEWKVASSPFTH